VINGINNFRDSARLLEQEWTGTSVLAWEPQRGTLAYASYSRGYKAGGFNLDRSALNPAAPSASVLQFQPELVDSFELGFKLDRNAVRLAVAGFYAIFDQFQLNTFNGVNFIVENISACRDNLNGGDRDFAGLPVPGRGPLTFAGAAATGRCDADRTRGGVTTKGVEVETTLFPAPYLVANLGYTYADTRYRDNLTGLNGQPLSPPLFALPGQPMSNAPLHVVTGGMTWTPPITDKLAGLVYMDFRYQSDMNTGSDLFPEKRMPGFMVVNARIGLNGNDRRWSIEAWALNLFNENFQQVAFNTPLQGGGTVAQTARGGPDATTLFGSFLGEPRTYGLTLRTRF
jgi:outer membrane receptor protein involved in Fe transport